MHAEAARLDVAPEVRDQLLALRASTLHRLLGWRPGSNSRFRHDRNQRLAHDVVIVDETSMVSLSLMARLIEALRSDARLVLVGDPGQLASIEAGAVLGDIVGPAARGDGADAARRRRRSSVPRTGSHRFGGGIAAAGRPRSAPATPTPSMRRCCARAADDVSWIDGDVAEQDALPLPCHERRAGRGAGRDASRPARAGRARDGARCAGLVPDPVRPPARALRRGDVDGADGGLARGRARRLRTRRTAGTSAGRCW